MGYIVMPPTEAFESGIPLPQAQQSASRNRFQSLSKGMPCAGQEATHFEFSHGSLFREEIPDVIVGDQFSLLPTTLLAPMMSLESVGQLYQLLGGTFVILEIMRTALAHIQP